MAKMKNEELKAFLNLYISLSEEKRSKLNITEIKEFIIEKFKKDEIDYQTAYGFANYNPDLKIKLDEILKNAIFLTQIRCEYLLTNETSEEQFIDLSIKAIKSIFVEDNYQIQLIEKIKLLAIERKLYNTIVDKIKTSGDIETIICAALGYEPKLIDEVFGGKLNMFIYLTANTFTDEQNIKYYISRLFEMDNNEFDKYITNEAKKIDLKIAKK